MVSPAPYFKSFHLITVTIFDISSSIKNTFLLSTPSHPLQAITCYSKSAPPRSYGLHTTSRTLTVHRNPGESKGPGKRGRNTGKDLAK